MNARCTETSTRGRDCRGAVLLAGATILAYLPALKGGFVWDDDSSLTGNRLVRAPDGLGRIWTTATQPDYWPVTTTSFWAEWRLWGMHAAGYHATNLALHIGTALLLWAVLRRLDFPAAFLAAFLFAVHPVNVESVAWIAERKNLLALLFFLLAVGSFIRTGYQYHPPRAGFARPAEAAWYGLSLLAFVLGMLSKGSVAPLPLILFGLIAWRRRPTGRDFLRLAPFVLVAAALAAVDVWFQARNLDAPIRAAGPLERLLGAGAAVWFYLGKALLPVHLTFVYPRWEIRADDWRWWAPLAAAAALTALLWRHRRAWGRRPLFAWGYFCAALLPVMGFTDVYFMRYSLVADHYQQIAIIAVVAAAAAGWSAWSGRAAPSGLPDFAAAGAICALLGLTWSQCRMYRDSTSLYLATLEANPRCWMAHNNLGRVWAARGRRPEAVAQYREALRLNPGFAEAHVNLGDALAGERRWDEAVGEFKSALRLGPHSAVAHNDLGEALVESGRLPEAADQFQEALRLDPELPEAHLNVGTFLAKSGRLPEAAAQYETALRIRPDYPEAENGLGITLRKAGRAPEAILHYEQALRLRPDFAEAENNLGVALADEGRLPEALFHFDRVLRLSPDNADAVRNRAIAERRLGASPR